MKIVRPPSSSLSEPSQRDSVRASLLNVRQTRESRSCIIVLPQKCLEYTVVVKTVSNWICSLEEFPLQYAIFFLAHSVGSALAAYKVYIWSPMLHTPSTCLVSKTCGHHPLDQKAKAKQRSLRHTANHTFNFTESTNLNMLVSQKKYIFSNLGPEAYHNDF